MLTPYQTEKMKNIEDDVVQMNVNRKRTEEGRQKYFKTMCEKVARYVVRRQSTSYLYPNTASAPSDRSSNSSNRDISKPSGETH